MNSWASIARKGGVNKLDEKHETLDMLQHKIQPKLQVKLQSIVPMKMHPTLYSKLQPALQPGLQPALQPELQSNIVTHIDFDMELIKNKHLNGLSEIYNILLDRLNNGYFTILTIDNNCRREQFINMLFHNFNINYHLRYDNFNSDSDVQEIINSDDEEFVPTYSKFAYS